MLLRFSVSNWMSFRDEATLDMVATGEKQHPNHLANLEKYNLKLLPLAMVYGANASGKSNLIKAIRFVQQFVTNPPKTGAPIAVRPFRLSEVSSGRPTSFRLSILAGEDLFDYAFSVTSSKVVFEELKQIYRTKEKLLFRRRNGTLEPAEHFPEISALRFAFQGTQDNQLFLTNSVSQKLTEFKPIFDWFNYVLTVIDPNTQFAGLLDLVHENSLASAQLAKRLRDLDSGIRCLREEDITLESPHFKEYLEELSKTLREGASMPVNLIGDGVYVRIENGQPVTTRVTPIHQAENGGEVTFSIADESDGTRRLLDLIPAFLLLEHSQARQVFLIDELDRSLHSLLTSDLLEHFLSSRGASGRSQLIFTTHDTQLMNQQMFRRDEIWITERDRSGASKLISFSEFKDVRKDKDIRRSYLQGRMGGIPRIRAASEPCEEEVETR